MRGFIGAISIFASALTTVNAHYYDQGDQYRMDHYQSHYTEPSRHHYYPEYAREDDSHHREHYSYNHDVDYPHQRHHYLETAVDENGDEWAQAAFATQK